MAFGATTSTGRVSGAAATLNVYLDFALRTMFAAIVTPRRLMKMENVARIVPLAMGPAPSAAQHVLLANVSMIQS